MSNALGKIKSAIEETAKEILYLTSFNEFIKLHFTLSSPSQGVRIFPGYPLK